MAELVAGLRGAFPAREVATFDSQGLTLLQQVASLAIPDPTRGNHKSQFHELTGELTSKVTSHYLSRSQWLQLPNPTARRRI